MRNPASFKFGKRSLVYGAGELESGARKPIDTIKSGVLTAIIQRLALSPIS